MVGVLSCYISVEDVDEIHSDESNRWKFKARLSEKDLKVVQGLLVYHARMPTNKINNLSYDSNHQVLDCCLSSDYYHINILASESIRIPLFDEMAMSWVFHVEAVPPYVVSILFPLVPDGCKEKWVAMDMKVYDWNSENCVFVELMDRWCT